MNANINRMRRTVIFTSLFAFLAIAVGAPGPGGIAFAQNVQLKAPDFVALQGPNGAYLPVPATAPGAISDPVSVDNVGVFRVKVEPVERHSMAGEVAYMVSLADEKGVVLKKMTLTLNSRAHFKNRVTVWIGSTPSPVDKPKSAS
jgi:hypothetical protein